MLYRTYKGLKLVQHLLREGFDYVVLYLWVDRYCVPTVKINNYEQKEFWLLRVISGTLKWSSNQDFLCRRGFSLQQDMLEKKGNGENYSGKEQIVTFQNELFMVRQDVNIFRVFPSVGSLFPGQNQLPENHWSHMTAPALWQHPILWINRQIFHYKEGMWYR